MPRFRAALAASLLVFASAAFSDDGAWQEMSPPMRQGAAGIYDPVRDRYLVYGGSDYDRDRAELWALQPDANLPWTRIATSGPNPPMTTRSTAIYDPLRDRMLWIMGGPDAFPPEVWALSLGANPAWSVVAISNGGPVRRSDMSVVLDPVGDRLVFFGGTGNHPVFGTVNWNETWELTLAGTPTWHLLAPSGTLPPPTTNAPAVYDPLRRRMLVHRGTDLWALALDTLAWTQVPAANAPTLNGFQLHADVARDRLLVYEARVLFGTPTTQVWTLPLAGGTYTLLSSGDPALTNSAQVLDPARSELVLFGGTKSSTVGYYDETWTLNLVGPPGWTREAGPLSTSKGRGGGAVFCDPLRPRLLAFGGVDFDHFSGGCAPIQLDLAGTNGWRPLQTSGGSPPISLVPMDIDKKRGQLVSPSWRLDLATDTWIPINATGLDPSFQPKAGVVDSLGDRLIVLGVGLDPTFQVPITAAWSLPLADANPVWTEMHPVGGPPRMALDESSSPVAQYDPRRNRVVYLGDGNEIWELGLAGQGTWTRLENLPVFFYHPTLGYDRAGDRLLIFYANQVRIGQTWLYTWSLSQPPSSATRIFPTGVEPRSGFQWSGTFDPPANRLLLLGWRQGFWAYLASTPVPPPEVLVSCPGDQVTAPGSNVNLNFQLGPVEGGGTLDYVISSQRNWPGLPVSGSVTLAAGASQPVPLTIAVPDTALRGENRIRLTATLRGFGTVAICDTRLIAPPLPPQVAIACPGDQETVPGSNLDLVFHVGPADSARTVDYVLTSERNWPGFPISGALALDAGEVVDLPVTVAVPETSLVGSNRIQLTATVRGTANATTCDTRLIAPGHSASIHLDCSPSVTWIPGGTARGRFVATVANSATTFVAWTVTGVRAWPGFPLHLTSPIVGGVATLDLALAVPDSVAAGTNRLLVVGEPAGEGVADSCTWVLSGPGGGSGSAVLEIECPPPVTWVRGANAQGEISATVTGSSATFVDYQVTSERPWPGIPMTLSAPIVNGIANLALSIAVPDTAATGTNVLRVSAQARGTSTFDACEWTLSGTGTAGPEYAASIVPNPTRGAVTLRLSLAHETSVQVQVFTLTTGRLVLTRDYGRLPAGAFALDLGATGQLASGAYVVRTVLDGTNRDAKLIVTR